jgi:gliding motility associated protien GldN
MNTSNNVTYTSNSSRAIIPLFTLVVLFTGLVGFSQSNILNAKDPSEIGKKTPEQIENDNNKFLKYGFIDDRDILWSKIVYERIDLSERINLPLLYPTNDALYKDERKSLWRIIKEAIINDSIASVYEPFNDNFTTKISIDSVKNQISFKEVVEGQVAVNQLESEDIRSYDIKGIWYFDKRMGEMKYRLLGIRPVGKDINASVDPDLSYEERELIEEKIANTPLFWLWYPDIRPLLHREKVFNERNNALRITFDQLLIARRFNSYIYKVDNVHEDRTISTYLPKDPFLQMMESNRIKEEIRNFEQDMWNY